MGKLGQLEANHTTPGLNLIIERAAELSFQLWTQRSQWCVRFPDDLGECREPDRMGPETGERVELTELVGDAYGRETETLLVFPGLYKRGDSEGNRYDQEMCVLQPAMRHYIVSRY